MNPKHPAKFTNSILEELDSLVPSGFYLDPFCGTGKVFKLERPDRRFIGIEIEPEWAEMDSRTVIGSALALPFKDESFDGVVTSPTYGNRFADHHKAKDGSVRRSYTHDLGRTLHPENSGAMHWGPSYREFHEKAWAEATRVARQSFFLNCKDHIRNKEVMRVTDWHVETLESLGWTAQKRVEVPVSGFGMGANHLARISYEEVVVLVRN